MITPRSNNVNASIRHRFLLACPISIIAAGVLGWAMTVEAMPEAADPKVEQAVLAEDWPQVLELLREVDTRHKNPVLRLIKGHACLVVNQNNESLCLFLSANSAQDLQAWDNWCVSLVNANNGNAIAHFLNGDAKGRRGKWKEALGALKAAAAVPPGRAIVLNARGVVHALLKETAAARLDFDAAISQSQHKLADAHANLGFLWIQRQQNAEAALEAFINALTISPDFALVLHGKGCVELLLPGMEAQAGTDLHAAMEKGACFAGPFQENVIRYAAARLSRADPDEVVASLKAPGTTLRTTFDSDRYGAAAASDFNLAGTFRGMKWLPLNQRFADFFGNRGVENLEKVSQNLGTVGITDWAKQHKGLAPVAWTEMSRVEKFNWQAKPFEQAMIASGSSAMGLGAGLVVNPIPELGGKLGGGIIAGSGLAANLGGNTTKTWSDFHTDRIPKIKSAFENSLGNSAFGWNKGSTLRNAGGADSAMPNWDDGHWPFQAFNGLGYGL